MRADVGGGGGAVVGVCVGVGEGVGVGVGAAAHHSSVDYNAANILNSQRRRQFM